MSNESEVRIKGICKFFDSARGFGFITSEDGGDVFVHYTAINAHGFKSLYEGQNVTFQVIEGVKGKGFQAANVEIVD